MVNVKFAFFLLMCFAIELTLTNFYADTDSL